MVHKPLTTEERFSLAQNLGLAILFSVDPDAFAVDVRWSDAPAPWVNVCGGAPIDPSIGHLLTRFLATERPSGSDDTTGGAANG